MHRPPSVLAAAMLQVCVLTPWTAGAQSSDRLGPIPRFTWIEPGQARPVPHIAETEIGLSPAPMHGPEVDQYGHRIVVVGDPPSDCYGNPDPPACLHHNWLALLQSFSETELAAPPGGRSYRFLDFPSFSPWVSIRLDVRADGSGMLTTSWTDHNLEKGQSHAGGSSAGIPVQVVAGVERSIAESSFERLVADPSALQTKMVCTDGADWVFEAQVKDRYRYVARHSCDPDEADILAIGRILVDLARTATPDARFDHGRPPIP